ncbi:MAG TPA: flagellar motor protein MotA [Acetobacteraceae bacterium]|jgi:methyl-accepting chemotaxis protein|nr:flagellar motor protein MotA [Acetobacteraceae bacterium]
MTRPGNYLLRMLVFLAAVVGVAGLVSPVLITAFRNNPGINSLILLVLLLGIAWNLRQVLRLSPEVTWVETFQSARPRLAALRPPKLLAPMANMLAARGNDGREGKARFTLSATAMRSLLDGIASRLDESRELSRYMTGLMIFLGLLGTFWGLLKTISSVSEVIGAMQVGSGDVNVLFDQLKAGLVRPLAGMGTAFSASMFGLSGALVLGFLDLTAGQAQNRFFNELEEWLASLTRLSSGILSEADSSIPVYVQALLEQTAENMENLQRVLTRGDDRSAQANQALLTLTERLATLSDAMRSSQQLMVRIAEQQTSLGPILQRMSEGRGGGGQDEAMRGHLRNIEVYLQRLLSDSEQGRTQGLSELRNDIRVLTRTVAALAEPPHG